MILSFKQGNQACLGELYDQYAPALLGVITRIVGNPELSTDCLQETFNEIWKQKSSYDSKKERIFSWIVKIARNSALNFLKNRHDSSAGHSIAVKAQEILEIEKGSLRKEVEIASLRPAPQQKEILDMVYLKGFTLAEAAARLNIPLETARIQFVIAVKQLKTKVSA